VKTLLISFLDKRYGLTADNFYIPPQLAYILIFYITHFVYIYIYICGTANMTRKYMSSITEIRKLKNTGAVAFQRGKVMVLQLKDKKDVMLLNMIQCRNGRRRQMT
jgi:hypothetical protein